MIERQRQGDTQKKQKGKQERREADRRCRLAQRFVQLTGILAECISWGPPFEYVRTCTVPRY